MPNDTKAPESAHLTNFIRQHIERDLAEGKYMQRRWGGGPGPLSKHKDAPRHGYFIGDRNESRRTFNRTVTLRDSWASR